MPAQINIAGIERLAGLRGVSVQARSGRRDVAIIHKRGGVGQEMVIPPVAAKRINAHAIGRRPKHRAMVSAIVAAIQAGIARRQIGYLGKKRSCRNTPPARRISITARRATAVL